jgi:hypothetical protein
MEEKEPCEHRKVDTYYDVETEKPVLWTCRNCMTQFIPVKPNQEDEPEEK